MKRHRIVPVLVILGIVVAGVTFLGAARNLSDEFSSSKESQVSLNSGGVVVFGNVGLDSGLDLLPLYPENFPQPGIVTKVLVAEGQAVKKGQQLAILDTKFSDLNVSEARAGVAMAEAAVSRAEAAVERANAALERANASVKVADQTLQAHDVMVKSTAKTVESKQHELDGANDELEAVKKKLESLKIQPESDSEYRTAKKKWQAAESALQAEKIKLEGMKAIAPTSKREEAQAGVLEAKAGVAEAKSAVAEAKTAAAKQQIAVDRAQQGLSMHILTAPSDGLIVRSYAAEGLTVGPQTRQPLFVFQPNGPLIVRAEVDQEFASRVAVGQTATIQDDGNANLKWTGKVLRIAGAFLPKRTSSLSPEGVMLNDNRVLECVVSVNIVDSAAPIRVGQRVKVSIGVEQ